MMAVIKAHKHEFFNRTEKEKDIKRKREKDSKRERERGLELPYLTANR